MYTYIYTYICLYISNMALSIPILTSAIILRSFGKHGQGSIDKSDIERINSKIIRVTKIAKGRGILSTSYKCPQLRSKTHS